MAKGKRKLFNIEANEWSELVSDEPLWLAGFTNEGKFWNAIKPNTEEGAGITSKNRLKLKFIINIFIFEEFRFRATLRIILVEWWIVNDVIFEYT